MKMRRISFILNLLVLLFLFSLYTTTINAAPTVERRQEAPKEPDFNTAILRPFLPLEATKAPETRDYTLTLSRAKLSPDGFERVVWTSNNQYPGPMIRANKGDRLVITLDNQLEDYCTIHWHGIFQVGTTYYDGVAGQTQCLIPAGAKFVYNFTLGEQYGTYWWHSHYLAQYVDGLRGPLIIHDPQDPFLKDYDEEVVLTLSDWYHTESKILVDERMKPGYGGFNPIPDSGLISGRGRCDCSKAPSGSKCNPNNPLATYLIQKGKRYRFRIINTSAAVPFVFSIDEHPLTLIEVEGENIKPVILNTINIAIGQRYSVIVNADKEVKNFWIRGTILSQCIERSNVTININSGLNYKVVGILKYEGAPDGDPNTKEWDEHVISCRDVDHNLLKLYTPRAPPTTVTDRFEFVVDFTRDEDDVGVADINSNTFVPDLYNPTVQKLLKGGNSDVDSVVKDEDQNAFAYDHKDGAVEIVIKNQNIATHPFHLHGHNFFIMGHGTGKDPDVNSYNLKDPAVRDTVTALANSWTTIRYNINNPGIWAFHCHIEWHVEMGMVGQLIERPSELKNMELPAAVKSICPKNPPQRRALQSVQNYVKTRSGRVRTYMRRIK